MTAIIARIILRYASGALVAAGLLDSELGRQIGADPDILVLVGSAIGLSVETAYAAARKLGWST